MQIRTLAALLLLLASGFAQTTSKATDTDKAHYPLLTYAEMPLYPRVPLTARISGTVTIQVIVKHGVVTDAQVKSSSSPFLSNPSIANVRTWRFERTANATFIVRYDYQIKGEETAHLENPKIELELPHLVTVIAKPLKPSCSDCRDGDRNRAKKSGGGTERSTGI
jgi:hypothetical protein